ncbi:MAG: iron-containing alcohol dehydrogenase [Desulfurococcaceae archaeon]
MNELLRSFRLYVGRTTLFFGIGALGEAFKESEVAGAFRKPLVVIGGASAEVSGALGELLSLLRGLGASPSIYRGVKPNPTISQAEEVADRCRAESCDSFIAVGGGSVIDVAKAARAAVAGGGRVADYFYGRRKLGGDLPLMAINLTHGTGSEVDRYAVLTDEATKEKRGFQAGYPSVGVDDPRYTLSLPRSQTLYTSIDAFAHGFESATSRSSSPFTELLGEEIARMVFANLPVALRDPRDLGARYNLMFAAALGGVSIDHALTHVGHGIEHALSGMNPSLPHGAGLAIIYRALIKHVYRALPETCHRLLRHVDPGLRPSPDDAERAQKSFNQFLDSVGFGEGLSDYGFQPEDVRAAAKVLMRNTMRRYIDLAPIKVTEKFITDLLDEVV